MNINASKSHDEPEIVNALRTGKRIAFLDSGCSGNDDLLIMDEEDTIETMQATVTAWLDNGTDPFESGEWSIRIVDADEFE